MSDFIYDPRPLDPPDYFDKEMSNTATWVFQRVKVRYSPEERIFKRNVFQERGEGSMKDVLQMIAQIHGGDSPDECEIFIDATQIVSRSEARQSVYFQVNFSDTHDVHWVLKEKTDIIDEDTDPEELFSLAEHMIDSGREFSIEFGTVDPTPQYLYDAFSQKQELRK